MNNISFEPPFHGICVRRKLLLSSNGTTDFLDLDQIALNEMPDVIILGDKRFKYGGVSDGLGQYREEKE